MLALGSPNTSISDVDWSKEVKGNMYDMIVEGFQLLSRWTTRIWEQCAWKFSRPCKDASPSFSDYEKVVRYNYSAEERKALVELVSYIKSVGSMMQRCDTLVADALWETIHAEVQDFVHNTFASMLQTTFRKKKDLLRILSDMRTLSADWMANTNKSESELHSSQHGGEESKANIFYPRAVAPTAAQIKTEKRSASLKEKLASIAPLLEDLKKRKDERLKQFANIEAQIEKISGEISRLHPGNNALSSMTVADEQDLSLRRLDEYQTHLRTLQKEKSERLQKVLQCVNEVHCLCGVLGLDFGQTVGDVHPSLHGTV